MKQLEQHRLIDKFSSRQISIFSKNRYYLKPNTFTQSLASHFIFFENSHFLQLAFNHRLISHIRVIEPVQNSISFKNAKQLMF